MDRDALGPKWPFLKFQKLAPSKEIPRVAVGSFKTEGWTVHTTLCVVCVMLWAVPRWTVGLFISPCELILGVIAMNE